MVKVTDSGLNRYSSVSSTIMQSLTFITFMVSEKITQFLCHAGKPNTDHYMDSHFFMQVKNGKITIPIQLTLGIRSWLKAKLKHKINLTWYIYLFLKNSFKLCKIRLYITKFWLWHSAPMKNCSGLALKWLWWLNRQKWTLHMHPIKQLSVLGIHTEKANKHATKAFISGQRSVAHCQYTKDSCTIRKTTMLKQ